jgi:hypothetical protein
MNIRESKPWITPVHINWKQDELSDLWLLNTQNLIFAV